MKKITKNLLLASSTLALLASCSTKKHILIPHQDLENISDYKCVNYLGVNGITKETAPPGSISMTAVQDECVIKEIKSDYIIIDFTSRSHTSIDKDVYAYKFKLNGKKAAPKIIDQTIAVKDYDYTGTYETAKVYTNILGSGFQFNLSEPAEYTFRVIERKVSMKFFTDQDLSNKSIKITANVVADFHTGKFDNTIGEIFSFKIK